MWISVYGVIMFFRERGEWEAVVTSCFAECGMMTMDVGDVADRRTIYKYNIRPRSAAEPKALTELDSN